MHISLGKYSLFNVKVVYNTVWAK